MDAAGLLVVSSLLLYDCARGAGVDASTAIETSVLVYFIMTIALVDSTGGAAFCTSAARDAIAGNFKSHVGTSLLKI